jgi:hypothetical protein
MGWFYLREPEPGNLASARSNVDGKPLQAHGGAFLRFLAGFSGSGVQAVNWLCVGITALTLVLFVIFMTKRAEAAKLRPDTAEELRKQDTRPIGARLKAYFAEGPFTNRGSSSSSSALPVRTFAISG